MSRWVSGSLTRTNAALLSRNESHVIVFLFVLDITLIYERMPFSSFDLFQILHDVDEWSFFLEHVRTTFGLGKRRNYNEESVSWWYSYSVTLVSESIPGLTMLVALFGLGFTSLRLLGHASDFAVIIFFSHITLGKLWCHDEETWSCLRWSIADWLSFYHRNVSSLTVQWCNSVDQRQITKFLE